MPSKFKVLEVCIIVLTLMIFETCDSIMEGELVKLDFPYPCNTSRVTLQYGIRLPFYNSANPESTLLPPNQNLTNENGNGNNDCSLHLTINSVLRGDAGTYILTAYDENGQYIYDARVGLRVDYPPGKASCESGGLYIEGEWIRVHCSAPVGNIPGEIVCYQNDKRLPPLTTPEESNSRLTQIILARVAGLVYCCSSTLQNTSPRCECKDCGWDPILDNAITDVTDPCPIVLGSTHGPTRSESSTESSNTTLLLTLKTGNKNEKIVSYWKPLVIVVTLGLMLILACLILNLLQFFKPRQLENCLKSFDRANKPQSVELE